MKVLHIIVGLNVGGAELVLRRLVLHSIRDVEHEVVSLTTLGSIGEELTAAGVKVHVLGLKAALGGVKEIFLLRKIIKKSGCDIVHTWMYHSDFLGGMVSFLSGRKNIVWCVRSTDIAKGHNKITIFIRRLCSVVSKFVPKKIIYAAESSRKLHEELGYDKTKSVVIPNGFSSDLLSDRSSEKSKLREKLGIAPEKFVIGSVGRFNRVKDHASFIKAAGILARANSAYLFVMIGRGIDRDNDALMHLLQEAQIQDRCYLLGERDDIADCMLTFDVFCLHSVTEGFPNVLGEAMACGLPVVTTDVGDASILVPDHEYCVTPASPSLLASSIARVKELSSDRRKNLGERNRDIIIKDYRLEVVVDSYMSLYRSLIKRYN